MVLVLVTIAGVALTRPGWNIRPNWPVRYWAVLWSLLPGSAALAGYVLKSFKIPTPYDTTTLNILTLLPGVIAVTGVEELLFRQVMFRWLEERQISGRGAVCARSVALGGGQLRAMLRAGAVEGTEEAVYRITINPLVWWVWYGGIVLALGGLISMWPGAHGPAVVARRRSVEAGYVARVDA